MGSFSVLALAVSPHALAQDGQSRAARAFADGERAFAAGDYARAATLFEEANQSSPHPATVWNIARSRHLGGELAKAANLYARFLQAATDAAERREAKDALATLEGRLGRVFVKPGGALFKATVDGVPLALGGALYVDPGEHAVVVSFDQGGRVKKSVNVAAGEAYGLDASPPAVDTPAPAPLPEPEPVRAGRGGLSPVVFAVSAGATVIVTGVAVWSGFDTLAIRDRYQSSGSNADVDRGLAAQTRTNVLIGSAIGLAVVTGVIAIFTDFKGAPDKTRATAFGGFTF